MDDTLARRLSTALSDHLSKSRSSSTSSTSSNLSDSFSEDSWDSGGSEWSDMSSIDWEEEKRALVRTLRSGVPIVFRIVGAAVAKKGTFHGLSYRK